jgi:shikimate dehydrogenase
VREQSHDGLQAFQREPDTAAQTTAANTAETPSVTFDFPLAPGVDNYAVMGNPIAHSKSPAIHHEFARQTGQQLAYHALLVQPGCFEDTLDEFQSAGGRGVNVTVPFKYDAHAAVSKRTARADRAGAVNTIWFDADGTRHGDTTDGVGLIRDLTRNGVEISGAAVLVLGAGGAVSGVLGDLLDCRPARLCIANRTLAKARDLARRFGAAAPGVQAMPYAALAGTRFGLVINGTSLSLQGQAPPLPDDLLEQRACCYDMVYGDTATPFMQWAEARGAALVLDGTGMLVEQAAEAFFIWRGVHPDVAPVIAMLRGVEGRR